MKKMIQTLLCEDNGDQICIAKIMALVAFVSFLGYATYGIYQGHFALGDFATGMMQVLFGSAGVIAGKNLTTK